MAKKQNATRRILIIIGALVVLLILVAVIGTTTGLLGNRNRGLSVETTKVQLRTLTQVVTASGKVQPEVEVILSPDVSGEIVYLGVKEGDQVEHGQLLVRIKPDFYEAQVEQASARVSQSRASLSQARANMLQAELDVTRNEELFKRNVIPESEFEMVQTQFEVAKASYEAAEFAVASAAAAEREAREQLYKTSIYAPMDGTISQLNIEVGERVVGTTQMSGTEMMRVARLDQMELEVDVNENDVVNVSLGDTASIEVDAYPERAFRGVVTEIANSARITGTGTQEQVTNFPVKIRILDPHNFDLSGEESPTLSEEELASGSLPNPQFRPGMSGTVDVYTATVPNALAIPIQAVTVRDFNRVTPENDEEEGDAEVAENTESGESSEESSEDTEEADEEESDSGVVAEEDLRKVVFINDDGKAKMLEVETGIADDTHIEIQSGLEEEQQVIIGPYSAVSRMLRPGSAVQLNGDGPTREG
jgi:HlyD family secretion protein